MRMFRECAVRQLRRNCGRPLTLKPATDLMPRHSFAPRGQFDRPPRMGRRRDDDGRKGAGRAVPPERSQRVRCWSQRSGFLRRKPRAAETIEVEGNRRIDAETVRSYFHAAAGRPLRRSRPRCGSEGTDRDRPVRQCHASSAPASGWSCICMRRRCSAASRSKATRRSRTRTSPRSSQSKPQRHAAARRGAGRRRPDHGSLPPCRARRCRRGAQDHRPRQRPRRPRLQITEGQEDHGAADQFRRQHVFGKRPAQRRDQDVGHQ